MNRRAFFTLTLGLVAAPLGAEGQQAGKVYRVGWLGSTNPIVGAPFLAAFRDGLRERGYVEGQNLIIEYRATDGYGERLPGLARELANSNVDVFVVGVNRSAVAAQQATTKIPIVMAAAEDPVGVGLVKSLARPGGNITGLTVVAGPEIYGKNLELLKEVLPKGARIATLFNAASPINAHYLKTTEEAARKLGVSLVPAEVRSVNDFEKTFAMMKQRHSRGFVVLGESLFTRNSRRVNELAVRNGLASMWPLREGVDTGGLMSYGTNVVDLFRRAATYVDKILKGADPADLPMEQPTKFELVINLKTAKALGLTIPQTLLQWEDQVIE